MNAGEWKTVQVIEVGKTPKGRATIKGAGEKDGLLVGDEVHTIPKVGQVIEGRISASEYNGKTNYWLNEWRLAANGQTQVHVEPTALATPDATLRFISNVVGQAIQAKTITAPEQIKVWAMAANKAMTELGEP